MVDRGVRLTLRRNRPHPSPRCELSFTPRWCFCHCLDTFSAHNKRLSLAVGSVREHLRRFMCHARSRIWRKCCGCWMIVADIHVPESHSSQKLRAHT